jgi:16S rRNA (cytosine967-C5)-methyltransferase
VQSKSRVAYSSVSPARAAAFDILLRVERDSSYASELLHSRTHANLSVLDHSLVTELVMGVLRWRSLLDSEIAGNSAQSLAKLDLEILIALRLAVYQLHWLNRVPARAAINESVELVKRARKRSAASFVNAVLRKVAAGVYRTPEGELTKIRAESVQSLAESGAHPEWLVKRWTHAYGIDVALRICQYNQTVPVTAIRLRHPDAAVKLKTDGVELGPGALLASARRLRGDLSRILSLPTGQLVIQDEASQLVAALLGRGEHILECCAAPGGKTLAIADRNPAADLTAVDVHPHRTRLLKKLLRAQDSTIVEGVGGVCVVTADARKLPFTAKFDRVLADVPCSGTGTLARNPEIKWRLIPEDLVDLQQRQMAILRSALDRVAIGGRLIYSTCSLEREENEDVVERCLAENPSFRIQDCQTELERMQQEGELAWPDLPSLRCGPYLRTLPGTHPCDGFFAAILQKH